VKKVWVRQNGTTTTYYVYDALGRLAAEYSDQSSTGSGAAWIFTDMLGSVRAITSEAGSSGFGSMTECYDYLPFGRILSGSDNGRGACHQSNPDDQIDSEIAQKFTGKERDAEAGLDYFRARYFSGALGRFLSADPENAGASHEDPQSWNAYAYARNNPLLYTDPDGMRYKLCTNDGKCGDISNADFNQFFKNNAKNGKLIAKGVVIGTYQYEMGMWEGYWQNVASTSSSLWGSFVSWWNKPGNKTDYQSRQNQYNNCVSAAHAAAAPYYAKAQQTMPSPEKVTAASLFALGLAGAASSAKSANPYLIGAGFIAAVASPYGESLAYRTEGSLLESSMLKNCQNIYFPQGR
jgi:RHS repeat-associated protein